MPEKARKEFGTESLVMTLNRAANRAALDAVVRHSELRGQAAERVARYAVHAAAPKIRAAQQAIILGTKTQEAIAVAAGAVALFAANLVVNVNVYRRGSWLGRGAAIVAIVGHTGMFLYSRIRDQQLHQAVAVRVGQEPQ
jgi:hypothetical protein